MRKLLPRFLIGTLLLVSSFPAYASEDDSPWRFDFYLGKSWTDDGSMRVRQGPGTDVSFSGVSYDDESFAFPPYVGLRLTYYPGTPEWLGLSIDYMHFKILADPNQVVDGNGTVNGNPVGGPQRLGDTVERFTITNGINYFMLNVFAEFAAIKSDDMPNGKLKWYVGVGAGSVMYHPETQLAGQAHQLYEWDGFAWQLFGGLEYRFDKNWGGFLEFKYTDHDAEVIGDESSIFNVDITTKHLVFGVSYRPN